MTEIASKLFVHPPVCIVEWFKIQDHLVLNCSWFFNVSAVCHHHKRTCFSISSERLLVIHVSNSLVRESPLLFSRARVCVCVWGGGGGRSVKLALIAKV